MEQTVYTLGVWVVQPGLDSEFISAWKELAALFQKLPHPPLAHHARLICSESEAQLYYSFGSWKNHTDIQAMLDDRLAQAGIAKLQQFCSKSRLGSFVAIAEA